ncbi:MAG: conjugal transfer protein TraF [Candidatus Nitrotoga sp.]
MFLKPLKLVLVSAMLIGSNVASALPFNSFDPRSMAMGGAGVAVGDAAMAPFFNPALLGVTKDEDDFSLVLPIIGVRVFDPKDFSTSVDNFEQGNYINNLQLSINAFNANKMSANATVIAADVTVLNTQLATLDAKPIQAEFGAAMVVGIPSKKYGGAFFASGSGALGGVINYRDKQTLIDLAQVASDAAACGNDPIGNVAACNAVAASPYVDGAGNFTFNTANLQSKINIRGVAKAETGISLAREFTIREQSLAIGLSPKIVKVLMFDVVADVDSNATLTGDDYRAEYTNFNFDLGIAKIIKTAGVAGLW